MKKLLKIDKVIIVEGKYDKIRLENIIDALILITNGFGIFKDKEKKELIKLLAEKHGIVIITDSDSAGMLIRSHLKGIVSNEKITNIYLPQIKGKEKRKRRAAAEEFLGVEGISDEIILSALNKANIDAQKIEKNERKIEKRDFVSWGISGGEKSAVKRKKLLAFLGLPDNISSNSFLEIANSLYGYDKFANEVEKWKQGQAEN